MGTGRPDNAGVVGEELDLPDGPELRTTADLEALADVLRAAGAPEVEVSTDAGGYVCERVFRHGLESGIPALFLHVPPIATMPVREQLPIVRAVAGALVGR